MTVREIMKEKVSFLIIYSYTRESWHKNIYFLLLGITVKLLWQEILQPHYHYNINI